MTLLLASWLATQTWAWDPVADAAKYRVYWGDGTRWCAANNVEFPSTVCDATECQGEIPMPPFALTFIVVTALDLAGNESSTEHGPVVVCP